LIHDISLHSGVVVRDVGNDDADALVVAHVEAEVAPVDDIALDLDVRPGPSLAARDEVCNGVLQQDRKNFYKFCGLQQSENCLGTSKKATKIDQQPCHDGGYLVKSIHVYNFDVALCSEGGPEPSLAARDEVSNFDSSDERGVMLGALLLGASRRQAGTYALEKQCVCNPAARG
jgi:hypothetical protein